MCTGTCLYIVLLQDGYWFVASFGFCYNPNVHSRVKLWGRSGGAKVLGKLPVPGRPTTLITVGQGPTALAVDAGGGCLDIFTLIYPFFSISPSLWETGPI